VTSCNFGTAGNAATTTNSSSAAAVSRVSPIAALPGHEVTMFAQADSRLIVSGPDSIAVDGDHVFIDYQNVTAKDCADADKASSTVVEYDMKGKILNHWSVAGHSDGMRMDPTTHLIWTTSCEDGNPRFATMDPIANRVTPYTFPPAPHGGGYDDLYFLNGSAFIAASNPTLNADGSNPNPAVDKIALGSNGTLTLTPVMMGNATAADLLNNDAATGLTLTDPDSMSVDNTGQLVLVSQGDSVLVFIKNPGAAGQKVSKMAVGTQLEDTVWPSGPGRLLVVDGGPTGATYWIDGNFSNGDVYTEAPNDSGIDNFVGLLNPATGFVTPIAIGFGKATGLVFVPKT
jgi:hypothetical protein